MFFALIITLNIYLAIRWRKFDKPMNRMRMMIMIVLVVSTVVTSLVIGCIFPRRIICPCQGRPAYPRRDADVLFSAALVSGGRIPRPGVDRRAGGFSGLLIGYYDNHNLFLPLVYFMLGMIFSFFVRQNYRTLPTGCSDIRCWPVL